MAHLTTPKKPNPAKAASKNKAVAKPKSKPTQVTVRYDAGFPNNLFIRGSGAGLSWDRGVPLKNIGYDGWVWETDSHFGECEFKVLINDRHYETGENHHLHEGESIQYTPRF